MASPPKAQVKIAIACQGGGSQTAFTAGALKALLQHGLRQGFDVVSVSGTSGGAVCAALVWYSFWNGDRPIWQRLDEFWHDNSAQHWTEQAFNAFVLQSMRAVNNGLLPTWQISPSSPLAQAWLSMATLGTRPHFTDFPRLLRKYIDFDKLAAWGPRPQRPALLIGAANVTTGKLVEFSSATTAIRIEHILASCAVPTIFPAVRIDGEAYWDGLFSDNPPVAELIRARSVGAHNLPDEIWLIKINPSGSTGVPEQMADIIDRRNQMEGNLSLFHQLCQLELLNDMIIDDVLRPEFLARFDVTAPIRIPKVFADDADKPYHIPCIELPAALQAGLDYEGKIDRSQRHIDNLMQQGAEAAERFLHDRAARVGL